MTPTAAIDVVSPQVKQARFRRLLKIFASPGSQVFERIPVKGVQVEIGDAISLLVHPEPFGMFLEESARKKRGKEMSAHLDFHPALSELRQELRTEKDVPVFGRPRVVKCKAIQPSLDRKSTRLNSSHLGISYAV